MVRNGCLIFDIEIKFVFYLFKLVILDYFLYADIKKKN